MEGEGGEGGRRDGIGRKRRIRRMTMCVSAYLKQNEGQRILGE